MRTHRFFLVQIALACALLEVGCQTRPKNEALRNGFQSLDQRAYQNALGAADRYLADSPNGPGSAAAMYLRGRAIEQRPKRSDAEARSDLREARSVYQDALALRPTVQLEAYIRTSLANVSYWLDDYATAEMQWTDASDTLNRDDLKSWVLYRIGVSQQRQGKWSEADATFVGVCQQYPGSEPAQRAMTHVGAREFNVQVAAFSAGPSADSMAAKLRGLGIPARHMYKTDRKLHVVLAGPVRNYAEALAMRDRLAQHQYKDVIIVH